MDTTTPTPGSIVVGIDGSASSDHALTWAIEQASAERRPLTLVHAVKPMTTNEKAWLASAGVQSAEVIATTATEGRLVLDQAADRVGSRAGGVTVERILVSGDARQTLLDLSAHAAMLVVGSRGRGPVTSLLLGSVSTSVTRHASCPAVVVRPHHPGVVRHGALVGTDATEKSVKTVEFAYRQASLRGLPLTVLYCFWDVETAVVGFGAVPADYPGFEEQRLAVAETLAGLSEKFPDVHVQIHLARGAAAGCLVSAGEQMDLIVVGHHHASFVGGPGSSSVATTVIEHASAVVAVVPDNGSG